MPIPHPQASARPLLTERTSGAAVLIESTVGAGRTFVVGTDETWRWPAATDGSSFWPQLIRRAIREPYAGHEGNLWLDVDPLAPQPAQMTRVRARVLSADGIAASQSSWPLVILKDGEEMGRISMAQVAPGRYETSLNDLMKGEYTLRVEPPPDTSLDIPANPVEVPLHVAPSSEAELLDVSGDQRLLRRIAEGSGGQLLLPEQLSSLPDRLAEIRSRQHDFERYPLWDSPYLYALVVASLSAEWALRKRWGLA
jgi:hypothetical protein